VVAAAALSAKLVRPRKLRLSIFRIIHSRDSTLNSGFPANTGRSAKPDADKEAEGCQMAMGNGELRVLSLIDMM